MARPGQRQMPCLVEAEIPPQCRKITGQRVSQRIERRGRCGALRHALTKVPKRSVEILRLEPERSRDPQYVVR